MINLYEYPASIAFKASTKNVKSLDQVYFQEHSDNNIPINIVQEYLFLYDPENKPDLDTYTFLVDALKAIDTGYSYKLIYALILVFTMNTSVYF